MSYIYEMVQRIIGETGTNDPAEICDALGITCLHEEIGGLMGLFTYIAEAPVIIISSAAGEEEQRLAFAHELGHYFLHSDIAKESVLREFGMFNMKDVIENEANVFASELLLDEDELLEHFEEGYTVFQAASMLGYNINLLYIKLREMNNRGYDFDLSWGNSELF